MVRRTRPGMTGQDTKAAQQRGFFICTIICWAPEPPSASPRSKIRGDALVLPVAVPRRFRALRALKLLDRRLGVRLGSFSARFGLRKRALCRRRELLAFPTRFVRCRQWSIFAHRKFPARYSGLGL